MADLPQAQPDASLRVEELAELVRQQAEAIQGLKTQLSKQITREIANTTQQLEAHQALQALIGDLPAPLHGWPISPDFALTLVRLIRDQCYDVIIEFGSGTSTLLCLRALEQFNLHSAVQEASPHHLITFEHLNAYHQKTTDLVASCSNRPLLDLRLSPLEPWADATASYSYYEGTAAIAEAIQAVATSVERPLKLLVVIDGPPGATCHWARYPAVPIVLDAASGMDLSVDFLLDDMIRTDEKEMALAWEQQLQAFGLRYQRVDYSFEKRGLLLSVNSLAGVDTSLARCQALAAEQQEQEAIAAAIARVDELLAELEAAKQAAAKEKATALQSATALKQQLSAQAETLQQTQKACDEQATRVKDLERELATLKGERDAAAKEKATAQQSATELKQQLSAQAETLQQKQKACDEQATRVKDLEGELATLKAERDAAAKEKAAAQQSAAELKQQLTAQAEPLQQAQKSRDEQAVRVKTLEGEIAILKAQQDGVVAGLQRLRHLAHPAGKSA
ncbi:MAG: hypothetical protein WAM11_12900 [Cyanobium sp.]